MSLHTFTILPTFNSFSVALSVVFHICGQLWTICFTVHQFHCNYTFYICYILYNHHIYNCCINYFFKYFYYILSDAFIISIFQFMYHNILFHKYSSIYSLQPFFVYVLTSPTFIICNIYHLFIFCITTISLTIFFYFFSSTTSYRGTMPCIGNVEPLILVQNGLCHFYFCLHHPTQQLGSLSVTPV